MAAGGGSAVGLGDGPLLPLRSPSNHNDNDKEILATMIIVATIKIIVILIVATVIVIVVIVILIRNNSNNSDTSKSSHRPRRTFSYKRPWPACGESTSGFPTESSYSSDPIPREQFCNVLYP